MGPRGFHGLRGVGGKVLQERSMCVLQLDAGRKSSRRKVAEDTGIDKIQSKTTGVCTIPTVRPFFAVLLVQGPKDRIRG